MCSYKLYTSSCCAESRVVVVVVVAVRERESALLCILKSGTSKHSVQRACVAVLDLEEQYSRVKKQKSTFVLDAQKELN